jgi:hypothetical protein
MPVLGCPVARTDTLLVSLFLRRRIGLMIRRFKRQPLQDKGKDIK